MSGVLIDTSVWVSHFKRANQHLQRLLLQDQILIHPLIVGEIACGTPPDRSQTLTDLGHLKMAEQATLAETLQWIEREQLYGRGCGLIDLTLLASVKLTCHASIWTLDKHLQHMATTLGLAFRPE